MSAIRVDLRSETQPSERTGNSLVIIFVTSNMDLTFMSIPIQVVTH